MVAVVWHDPALNSDPELVRSVCQAMVLALENGRLEAELGATTSELAASRARIVAVGDAGRRAVERDLHDGAQQRLVALRMKVERARELAETDPEVEARLADVGHGLDDVMRELRDLARGIYPPVLRDFGLVAALASAAGDGASPVALEADDIDRYPDEIETAVYFCCLEALQNVRKHAGTDAHAKVRLGEDGDELCFEIADDGVGYAIGSARTAGAGITNMGDRIAAVGGVLAIDSRAGHGTRVRGRVPLARLR
jgi:signal transduction histidine kinase